MKSTFAIIGCGRAGLAFAKHLTDAGYPPAGFASRSIESARHAAAVTGFEGAVSTTPGDVAGNADIILITTPDSVIRQTAEALAGQGNIKKGALAFHCSGAQSSAELSALEDAGVKTGSIHPLQSFGAGKTDKNPFDGIMIGIEGDPAAVETAWQIAQDLGATPFEIETRGKMIYHASAVVASNYLVTLMKMAMDLLGASGVEATERFSVLKPLVMGTLSNIKSTGPVDALTGPIARGDVDTVRAHVAAIGRDAPQMLTLYQTLGRYTVDIASERNSITEETRQALLAALSES